MFGQNFQIRVVELDAIIAQCRGKGPFAAGLVRDASNRSGRDWPWWGISIEQTQTDGPENRRGTMTVTLSSTHAGEPHAFRAEWRAQVWRGVNVDTFRQSGAHTLDWRHPTPEMFQEEIAELLTKAKSVVPSWAKV